MTASRVVIGIGNPDRGDDGVGPALVARLARDELPDTELVVSTGDPMDLITAWTGAEHVIVVDAACSGRNSPGTIHRCTEGRLPRRAGGEVGTHGLGLAEAIRLSAVLELTPPTLVIYAVERADTGFGHPLTADVARAVPELRRRIIADFSSQPSDAGAHRTMHVAPI